MGIGFSATAGEAREADALPTAMPERVADRVPDDIRGSLEPRPDSVGLHDVVHRD